jgi:hypothetical protein
MPCDSMKKPNQTLAQRREEIRKRMKKVDRLVAQKKVKLKVGPQGAVVLIGLSAEDRDGMTDSCIVRRIMATGSAPAKLEIEKARILAGCTPAQVQQAVKAGVHSHDGGASWHPRG